MSDVQHSHGDFDNDQSAYTHPDVHTHHSEEEGKSIRKKIWQVFWILFVLTAIEFVIAFAMTRGTMRHLTFVIMTLFKAFYIVGTFMHLKDEIRSMVFTILIPMTFIAWFILALLIEGGFYQGGWFGH